MPSTIKPIFKRIRSSIIWIANYYSFVGCDRHPLKANVLPSKKAKGKTMHLLLITPLLASDALVAPSGAVVFVILAVLAVLRSR